jgi:putative restriction endonuclease
MTNVLPLSKTHHAAFDRGLFTLDEEYHLRVNPEFDTECQLLQQTIIEQAGEPVSLPNGSVNTSYIAQYNSTLEWI